MKKTSILDFFKCQPENSKVNCPACDTLVNKAKLNDHLDSFCSSSSNDTGTCKNINEFKLIASSSNCKISPKGKKISTTSSKLNLKTQRKRNGKVKLPDIVLKEESIQNSDDEIIILKEISSPQSKSECSKKRKPSEECNFNKIYSKDKEEKNLSNSLTSEEESFKKTDTFLDCKNLIKTASKKRKTSESIDENKKIIKTTIAQGKKSLINKSSSYKSSFKSNKTKKNDTVKVDFTDESVSLNVISQACEINVKTEVFPSSLKKSSESIEKNDKVIKTRILNGEGSLSSDCSSDKSSSKSNKTKKKGDIKINSDKKSVHLNEIAQACETVAVKSEVFPSSRSEVKEKSEQEISNYQNVFEDASAFSELSDDNETEEKKEKTYAPYYIANFKHILETVLNNEDNKILFNKDDMHCVNAFKSLSDASQKMYVRLFQRKYKWLRVDKIKYPDITDNIFATLEELAEVKLADSGSCDIDLETAMNLLSLPEAKTLAKHFNCNSGKNKTEIKAMLIKHSKQHKSVFFMSGQNGIANAMLKKLRQIVGPCYRLSLLPKRLFTRILMLFNLPLLSEDDDDAAAGGQQQQLLTLLQINKGELSFPEYKQTKKTVIFIDRDELIRYEEARQLENDIFNAVEYKKFDKAKELYLEAKEEYEDQCSKSFVNRASSLPVFLKRYTSFHVYIRCMSQGVEILQKLREYKEAVSLLKNLLKQKDFCQDYKGRWYDRLALNLEQHLKKKQKALEVIKEGLQDKNVRVGHRYSLLIRGLRITKSLDDEDELKKQLLREADVIEAPKITIKGRLCPRPILGRRHVFISASSVCSAEDDVTILGVEQLAIEHYKEEGYIEGIHGEGSTFISLYALLFWDIIYDGNVPDVFISPYQTHPLDLNSEKFFSNREKQILNHLETIKFSTNEELKEIVKVCWENNHGKASLVSWDRFRDLEHLQGLVCCFGNCFLSGICERIARDFRFTRSGVPDLVVWNPESLTVKVVEVKGPGDKLSSKQILWLDYLIKLGVDAEVCLVEAEGSKMLKKEKKEVENI